jgi:hypothetical protein
VFVYLGLREAPLGHAAVRGFRLEVVVNRTQFAFRIDRWDHDGHTIIDHVAGSEDLMVAMAAYEAACRHWPGENHNAASRRQSDRGQPQRGIGMTMRALVSADRSGIPTIPKCMLRFSSRAKTPPTMRSSS